MAYIEWSKDFELGVEPIDGDHQVLVSLLNQVAETVGDDEEKATLGSVINSLVDYTEYHFAREERIQETCNYPKFEDHKKLHAALAERVVLFRDRFISEEKSVDAGELLGFLKRWLLDHIMVHDIAIKPYITDLEAAQRAADSVPFDTTETAEPEPDIFNWDKLSFLIVDDNMNFRMIIQTILKALGANDIEIASNAAEGLEKTSAREFSLIMSDWRMEGMDGLEFVAKLRENGCKAKVLMVSGYGDGDFAERAKQAGVDAFLEKPIKARGVLETITRVLAG